MLKEFRDFINRGNLVQLAVAFIIGVAFASVVAKFTDMVLGALSFVTGGHVSFDRLAVHRGSTAFIPYGAFLTALVSFVIVAFALFLLVRAYERWFKQEENAKTKPCPFCKTGVPVDAIRCPACTSELPAAV
jgi:large conductance mechanosensitive channel